MALSTERMLFPTTRLVPSDDPAVGKALLVRDTSTDTPPTRSGRVSGSCAPAAAVRAHALDLAPVTAEADWQRYLRRRIEVEAEFGVDAAGARTMVADLRTRSDRLGLDLYLARDGRTLVGAIGRFRLPAPHADWARLQEVDVFPAWRNQGYGNAMLTAMLGRLAAAGVRTVVVGADEDDWPLAWYRRRAFRAAARVPLTR